MAIKHESAKHCTGCLARELAVYIPIFLFSIYSFNKILKKTDHLTLLAFFGGLIILTILISKNLLYLTNFLDDHKVKIINYLNNTLIIVISLFGMMIILEEILILKPYSSVNNSSALPFSFPQNYKYQTAKIAGATHAFYWHQKLHVFNKDLLRYTTDTFPAKKPGILRIIVIGDSHAYGYGIAAEDTYPSVIEKELKKNFQVEVINLGIPGAQPHTYLELLTKYIPTLQSDLVINGITLNDFMPPGKDPYASDDTLLFPLPRKFKLFMIDKTELGKLFNEKYNVLLFKLGLRNDYLSDIIRGKYQKQYAQAVKKINDYVLANNLPPVIAFVTDQQPDLKGKNWQVTQITEKILKEAGFQVISSEDYYTKYNGQVFFVSPEEHHPNEEDNKIFAQYIINYLKTLPNLEKYKI